ncbi:MAG: alpha/beta fold hydrolase [Elainellaceae cyanobacterium]
MPCSPQTPSQTTSLPNPRRWTWRGFSVVYQAMEPDGIAVGPEHPSSAVVLIHGFGASWGHWRQNISALAQANRVYAIDLIGFGGSDKPAPEQLPYTFETWGQQVADFCREVVGESAFLVGNSIGCIVALQTAVSAPDLVRGVAMLNCSLRLLHDKRRSTLPWHRRVGAPILQRLLGIQWLGYGFFKLLARRGTVKNVLTQAYASPERVTDELVEMLLQPSRDPGAADVFLAFTRYSSGPLPEELLAALEDSDIPILILWGVDDPWEPVAMGRTLAQFSCVEDFIPLENAGHCPQDEVPEQVNAILNRWLRSQALAAEA